MCASETCCHMLPTLAVLETVLQDHGQSSTVRPCHELCWKLRGDMQPRSR